MNTEYTGATQWKSVPEFPAYEINDHGDIRRDGRIKTQMSDRKGYRWVSLWKDSKSHTRHIAKIVAQVFVGPMPEGQQVRHKDGHRPVRVRQLVFRPAPPGQPQPYRPHPDCQPAVAAREIREGRSDQNL